MIFLGGHLASYSVPRCAGRTREVKPMTPAYYASYAVLTSELPGARSSASSAADTLLFLLMVPNSVNDLWSARLTWHAECKRHFFNRHAQMEPLIWRQGCQLKHEVCKMAWHVLALNLKFMCSQRTACLIDCIL